MKVLIVSLDRPEESHYHKKDAIGSFLWGRQIQRYPVFVVSENRKLTQIEFDDAEVTKIQAKVNAVVELLELRQKVAELQNELKSLRHEITNWE